MNSGTINHDSGDYFINNTSTGGGEMSKLSKNIIITIIIAVFLISSGWVNIPGLSTSIAEAQTTYHVDKEDPSCSDDSDSEGSEAQPFCSIQYAIDNDNVVDEDIILVHAGTYYENIVFNGTKDITVKTYSDAVIDGGGNGSVVSFTKFDFSTTWKGGNSTLSGFTIIGGTGTYREFEGDTVGGGIYSYNSSPNIRFCTIKGNKAEKGGGIYFEGFTALVPSISYCVIKDNTATTDYGGGIALYRIDGVYINNNTITGNKANSHGGGIALWESHAQINKNIISGNQAITGGAGGIFWLKFGNSAWSEITNCVITGNYSGSSGGGLLINLPHSDSELKIINCTISANHTDYSGGAISCHGDGQLYITNTIFWQNKDTGTSYTADEIGIAGASTSVTLEYCNIDIDDIYGHPPTLSHITNYDPEFEVPGDALQAPTGKEDYHLKGISPCIDAGTSDNAPNHDIESISRPQDGDGLGAGTTGDGSDYDMGAYEHQGGPPYSPMAVDDTYSIGKNKTLYISTPGVLDNDYDADGDSLSAVVVKNPAYGILSPFPDGSFIYEPKTDFIGDDSFTYRANDGTLYSRIATVIITVTQEATTETIIVPRDFPTINAAINSIDIDDEEEHTIIVRPKTNPGEPYPNTYFENIVLDKRKIILRAEGNITIDGSNLQRTVVEITNDKGSTLEGFTIRGGSGKLADWSEPWRYGGGIYCINSSPMIKDCVIIDNNTHSGGGIYCENSSLQIIKCTIKNNTAMTDSGGGIHCKYSSPEIIGSTISNNTNGSGIYCFRSSATITGCTISNNTNGKGICFKEDYSDPYARITDCIISDHPKGSGIDFDASYAMVVITRCNISNNTGVDAGGISLSNNQAEITDCNISNNTGNYAGGISFGKNTTITNCIIEHNTSGYNGGGIYCCEMTNIINCKITDNRASEKGGGIFCELSPLLSTINGCTISCNRADMGGGIFCTYFSVSITNCAITGNKAFSNGGGIFATNSYFQKIINCTISGNHADDTGGGIFIATDGAEVISSILWGNEANTDNEIYLYSSSSFKITYSVIQGGWKTQQEMDDNHNIGKDLINHDPKFGDQPLASHAPTPEGDFRLKPGSPCIDAANSPLAPAKDINGDSRYTDPNTLVKNGIPVNISGIDIYYDIGAQEFLIEKKITATAGKEESFLDGKVTITFDSDNNADPLKPNVPNDLETTVTELADGTSPPTNFKIAGQHYQIDGSYEFSGLAEVCIKFDPSGLEKDKILKLSLWHYDSNNPAWVELPSTVEVHDSSSIPPKWIEFELSMEVKDYEEYRICAMTDSFSEFAIFYPGDPRVVGFWTLDEGVGNVAFDLSDYINDGEINGASWTADGWIENALSFDGDRDYVNVENDSSLRTTEQITVRAWFKMNASGSYQMIVSKTDNGGYQLGYDNDGLYNDEIAFMVHANGSYKHAGISIAAIALDTWYHVAGTYDGSKIRFYLNGVERASTDVTGPITDTPNTCVFIGEEPDSCSPRGWSFNGVIDEVVICNQALPAAEIMDQYLDEGGDHDTTPPTFSGLASVVDAHTDGEVNLSWSAASDPDIPITYNIYYATSPGGQNFSTPDFTTQDISYQVTGLSNDQSYSFVVRAEDVYRNEDTNEVELTVTPTTSSVSVPAGAVAYWNFDEGSGSVTLDQSNNSNDGTINGASWAADGWIDNALNFDGDGDYVNVGNDSSLRITGQITVGAWFKLNASGNYQMIVSKTDGGGYQLGYDNDGLYNGKLAFMIHTNGSYKHAGVSIAEISLDTWYYVVGTYDGSKIRFYLNGVEKSSTNATGSITDTPNTCVFIGDEPSQCSSSNWSFNGVIDEVVICNQALSSTEIMDQYLDEGGDYDTTPPTFSGLASAVDAHTDVEVNLSWSAASDPNLPLTYNIYYATSPGGQDFSTPDFTTQDISYQVTGLSNDQSYSFVVRAEDVYRNEDTNEVELTVTPTNSSVTIPAGAVGYWNFGEGSGNVTFDQSNNSNDGTINGASWATGMVNDALSFDGDRDYVNVGNDSSLRITGQITVGAWFKLNATGSYQMIVSKTDGGGYQLGYDNDGLYNGKLAFMIHTNGSYKHAGVSIAEISLDTWYYVVGTYDGSTIRFYLNGVERASTNASGSITDTPNTCVFIGEEPDSCSPRSWSFNGVIDEVVICNQTLSSTEIMDQYLDGGGSLDTTPPTFSGLASAVDAHTDGEVNLSWSAASDPNLPLTYNIYYATSPGGQDFSTPDFTTQDISYQVTGLSNDQSYSFVVRAEDVYGNEDNNEVELTVTPTTSSVTIPAGAVGYWNIDEGSGNVALDQSNNSNDGTINGASWTTGMVNDALSFDGDRDYVNVGNDSSLRITGQITVGAWFKLNASGNYQMIVSKTDGGGYQLGYDNDGLYNGKLAFMIHTNGSYKHAGVSIAEIALDTWYYVVGTYDGSTIRFYLNGVERASTNASGSITNTPNTCVFIGDEPYQCSSSNWSFNGDIDEVTIYDRALTTVEIQNYYNAVMEP